MRNPAKQQHTYEKQNEHQNPQCSLAHNLKLPPRDLEFIQHQRNQLICFKSPAKRTRTSNQCQSSWPAHNDYAKHEQCVQICLAVADRQSPCCCSNTTTTMFARRCLRNLETRSSRSLAPELRVKRIFQLAASKRILVKSGHFGCDYSTSDQ